MRGKQVKGPTWELLGTFGCGLASVKVEGKIGYVDVDGEVAIEPRFELGQRFQEDHAVVRVDGKQGLIDKKGKLVVPAKLEQLLPLEHGLCVFREKGLHGFIDARGKIVLEPRFTKVYPWSEGFAVVEVERVCGLVDAKGKLAIPCEHDFIDDVRDGLAVMGMPDGVGYVDPKGKVVIPPRFEGAWRFSEGLARVRVGEQVGYVRKDGAWLIEPSLAEVRRRYKDEPETTRFVEGRAVYALEPDGPFGYLDREGRRVTEPVFAEACSFSGGLARVRTEAGYGFIRPDGAFAIEPRFVKAGDFVGGFAPASLDGAEHGFLRPDGAWLVEPAYVEVAPFAEGVARVKRASGWGLLDGEGREVIGCEHELIAAIACERVPVATSGPDPEATAKELARVNAALAKVMKAVEPTTRPFLRLVPTPYPKLAFAGEWWKGEPKALGKSWRTRSKLGGTPYLPAGVEHPTGPDDEPLFLLAQLDLAELPALEGFPRAGLLQFYVAPEHGCGLDPEDLRSGKATRVLYHPDTKAKAGEPAAHRSWSEVPLECVMTLEATLDAAPISTSVATFDKAVKGAARTALEDDRVQAAYAVVSQAQGHKLGGWPLFTQEDPRSEKRYKPFEALLLQLDGDAPGIDFGDAGVASFFIEPARLAALDFSRVMFTSDCL